jgi:hypothetical protein
MYIQNHAVQDGVTDIGQDSREPGANCQQKSKVLKVERKSIFICLSF